MNVCSMKPVSFDFFFSYLNHHVVCLDDFERADPIQNPKWDECAVVDWEQCSNTLYKSWFSFAFRLWSASLFARATRQWSCLYRALIWMPYAVGLWFVGSLWGSLGELMLGWRPVITLCGDMPVVLLIVVFIDVTDSRISVHSQFLSSHSIKRAFLIVRYCRSMLPELCGHQGQWSSRVIDILSQKFLYTSPVKWVLWSEDTICGISRWYRKKL